MRICILALLSCLLVADAALAETIALWSSPIDNAQSRDAAVSIHQALMRVSGHRSIGPETTSAVLSEDRDPALRFAEESETLGAQWYVIVSVRGGETGLNIHVERFDLQDTSVFEADAPYQNPDYDTQLTADRLALSLIMQKKMNIPQASPSDRKDIAASTEIPKTPKHDEPLPDALPSKKPSDAQREKPKRWEKTAEAKNSHDVESTIVGVKVQGGIVLGEDFGLRLDIIAKTMFFMRWERTQWYASFAAGGQASPFNTNFGLALEGGAGWNILPGPVSPYLGGGIEGGVLLFTNSFLGIDLRLGPYLASGVIFLRDRPTTMMAELRVKQHLIPFDYFSRGGGDSFPTELTLSFALGW